MNPPRCSRLALAALLAALSCAALLLAPAGAAAAVPDFFTRFPADGLSGEAAGRLDLPKGIAAAQGLPGDLYVADWGNNRIDEFSPWGGFVRAFGWGVDKSNPEAKPQVCTAETGCRKGLPGSGTGQFDRPASVALDSAGNVYVVDKGNPRVQKFDSEGHFLLAFGWGVRDGNPEAETCGPAASPPSATCEAGIAGSGEGQIRASDFPGRLAIGPGDTVFLADGERIERFSSPGAYEEQIEMPAGKALYLIAVDAEGKLYASFRSGEELNVILKLEPNGPEAEFIEPKFDTESEAGAGIPALDAKGNVYTALGGKGSPNPQPGRVLEFDPEGNCLDCGSKGEGGEEGFDRSQGSSLSGIAAGAACGPTDVYVSHQDTGFGVKPNSYIKIFGEHPDTTICPPPKAPPSIEVSYAASVGSGEAELRAQINPHFWDDTTYYLQYGTAPCSEGGCEALPAPPGRRLSEAVTGEAVSAPVLLEGLRPATTYHYRFVAQGSGSEGQPVRGVGGTPGADGAEGVFRTFAPPERATGCPNDSYRLGPGAYLPDCRAYELVSPLEKNNGDVLPALAFTVGFQHVRAGLEQSSASGDRLAYSSATAFADAQSAPFTSQYIAQRIAGSEWRTHAISPPRGRILGREEGIGLFGRDTEFKIFSPDLCQAWLRTMTDMPLAAGEVADSFNLYRREDRLCAPGGEDAYEALTTIAPTSGDLGIRLEPQGVSADGQTALYRSRDSLAGSAGAPGALQGQEQLYVRGAGGQTRFACVLPGGGKVSCLAGSTAALAAGSSAAANIPDYWSSLAGAISADGRRVFWSTPAQGGGTIYLRENPLMPPSAQAFGSATGTGRLVEGSTAVTLLTAAKGKGDLSEGSPVVTLSETTVGQWAVGQPVSGAGIPAGATVESCAPECGPAAETLTLSAPATQTKTGVAISSKGPMPFAVGQTIIGEGIPAATTIEAVKAGGLTLSKAATVDNLSASLEAFSECTEAAKACTVAVSAAGETLSGAESSRFLAASPDGAKALYIAKGKEGASDLYEFDLATEATQKIAGDVPGIMGASEGLGIVYFISEEALAGAAQPGDANLYRYEAGEGGGAYRFIATLAGADTQAGEGEGPVASPVALAPASHLARVSADASHLAFASVGRPTGYDNTDQASGQADAEVYLYDADAQGGQGELVCASCNPSGARPVGREEYGRQVAASIPGWENSFYASRALSGNGGRLFFESFDALTPRDTNGRKDVYQWEAPGEGSCTQEDPSFSPSNGGCLGLISSGTSPRDSEFRDASPDGHDVFFATLSSLLPPDYGLIDIYDARVEGGLPLPAQTPPSCEGEACQSPPEAPNDPTPASASFQGANNVPPAHGCPKGKREVRRHGKTRCTRHHKRKHRPHRDRRAAR